MNKVVLYNDDLKFSINIENAVEYIRNKERNESKVMVVRQWKEIVDEAVKRIKIDIEH